MKKNYFLLLLVICVGHAAIGQAPARALPGGADTNNIKIPASATVFTLSGLNFNLYNSMPDLFHGYFSKSPYTMKQVKYPASLSKHSIPDGVSKLDEAIRSTPGPKIVIGHSLGAQVCSRWMRANATDTTAPGPDELIFILTGNPIRSCGGYIIGRMELGGTKGLPTPTNTPWRIIDFARRYDGWADWVQDERNRPAVKNAEMGKFTFHKNYIDVDFFSSSHTVWKFGNTTYVLTYEEKLPIPPRKSVDPVVYRNQIESAYTNRPVD